MVRGVVLVAVLGACSFQPRAAGTGDAARRDGPDRDAPDGGGSGSNAGGAKRKALTIDKMKVAGSLDDFELYVELTDADLAAAARADGHDIYFTDAQGVALSFERELYAGGHLIAWVHLPHIDNSANLTIYVGYGDLAKATAPDPAGTFPNYAAVWHMDDALTSPAVADTTGGHPGTAVMLGPTAQVAGKLGGAIAFDGSGTQRIDFSSPLTGTGQHTISAWVNQQQVNHTSAIVTVGTNATDQARFVYGAYGGGGLGAGLYNDDWQPNADLQGAGWKLVHWTYNGTDKKSHLFVDGTEVTPMHTFNAAANTPASTGSIGWAPQPSFGADNEMLGQLDEVRIATALRPPAWCATEFANQSSPGTFYSVGAEQPAP
ncbi:MAG: DUF2341 domain-containing protein [Deltaproteobacteria bacterium]|nr:DUF2341 domain-containing protein [Deltaproteobacteria bacterium]